MHVCLPTIGSLHDIMKYESSISKVELVNHEWVPQNNGGIGLGLHKWALCGKEKCEFHLSTTVILPFKYCCSVYQVDRATWYYMVIGFGMFIFQQNHLTGHFYGVCQNKRPLEYMIPACQYISGVKDLLCFILYKRGLGKLNYLLWI